MTVTYADDSGIDATSIDTGDVSVTGPNGPLAVTGVTVVGNGHDVTATYTIAAPGSSWDAADNGAYTVAVNAGAALVFYTRVLDAYAAKSATAAPTPARHEEHDG